jgi:dTDP-4-dehydrorhamnose 3,5-epimerase
VARVRNVRIRSAALEGVFLVDIEPHVDERGAFSRTYCEREFAAAGLPTWYPQCNLSSNHRAFTLRGMHYNAAPFGESKLVRCVRGAIYDVVVDLRRGSLTRMKSFGVELSADNGKALYIPAGFAHGFLTLVDSTDVYYHMGDFYRPDAARGFRWDDPTVAIEWPTAPVVVSEVDSSYPDLVESAVQA